VVAAAVRGGSFFALFLDMCPWMGLVVHLQQTVQTDVGVFLGGGKGRVSQQLLNGAQITSSFQQMGGKGVA